MSATSAQEQYPQVQWATTLDIPLKDSDEVVSIDLVNDLPPDPTELTSLLIEENSNREHWLKIAIAYCNQNKLKEGIRLVELALDVFQGALSAQLHTFLTWAYLSMAKRCGLDQVQNRNSYLLKSEDHLKSAINYEPTWIGNMLATIDIYYQRRQYDKALETAQLFSKAIVSSQPLKGQQASINVLFILLKAKLYYQKKNYSASLKLFQELLILNPVLQPDSRIGIGLCFWQLRDYEMAIMSWKRSLELNPNNENVKILVSLSEYHNSLHNSGNDNEFVESYTKYLQNLQDLFQTAQQHHNQQVQKAQDYPEYAEVEEVSPVLYCLLQSYYYFKGEHASVLQIYEKTKPVRELLTNDLASEISFWCGRSHYVLKDYKSAFQMFQESLKSSDENFLSRFGLGQSQYQNNLVEEALLTFENLYKANESIQELNYVLGMLYSSKIIGVDKKASGGASVKKSAGNEEDTMNKAIFFVEKYIRLTKTKKNQLVNLNAYLTLSQLYEQRNMYSNSLECLSKVIHQLEYMGEPIPLEIYNNMGCYYFSMKNMAKAKEFFEKAQASVSSKESSLTIDFNVARTSEETDGNVDFAVGAYNDILQTNPSYITARMRHIFIDYVKGERGDQLETEIENMMAQNSQNLEVRSLYSWYLKNVSSKKVDESTGELLESKHNKNTLTNFDSHDLYALVSLANVYVNVARNSKRSSSKEFEKIKHSYIKAIHLYNKVLTLDPYNVFAAQGLAICFAENAMYNSALDVLRKVRDSLDDKSVYMNMGHCFTEVGEYVKAIDNYSMALTKCSNEVEKADVLNLLGRVWLLRGLKESSLEFVWKSLELVEKASQNDVHFEKFENNLKYNRSSLYLYIGNMLVKTDPSKRLLADLEKVQANLDSSSVALKSILDKEQVSKFFNKDDLKHKISQCDKYLKQKIAACIEEQVEFEGGVVKRLEHAKKYILEEEERKLAELKAQEEEQRLKKEKDAAEFSRLQESTQQYMQERADLIRDEDDKDSTLPEEEDGEFSEKKSKRKRKSGDDTKSKKRAKKAGLEDDDDDDEDEDVVTSSKVRSKKSALSNELIEDSDEDEAVAGLYDDGSEEEVEEEKEAVHSDV